jgi:hypothetical protein
MHIAAYKYTLHLFLAAYPKEDSMFDKRATLPYTQ